MRILICGDRHWKDYPFIFKWVEQLVQNHEEVHHILQDYPGGMEPLVIIEGGAPGVDTMARIAGETFLIEVIEFPADWGKFGRRAGPKRNQQMLDEGKPDFVLAFHDDIKRSRGTKNMLAKAKKAGIRHRLITHLDGTPDDKTPDPTA